MSPHPKMTLYMKVPLPTLVVSFVKTRKPYRKKIGYPNPGKGFIAGLSRSGGCGLHLQSLMFQYKSNQFKV